MNTKEILTQLCNLSAVSGFEHAAALGIADMFSEYCDDVSVDLFGNVIAILNNTSPGKTIMIDAHLDEIGLMVSYIEDNGFLRFTSIGGIDPIILPATEVVVHGKEKYFGVVGAKPPHLQTSEECKKSYKIEDLFIDVGFDSETVKKIIDIGDVITFKSYPTPLLENRFCSKSLDNRVGVSVLLQCANVFSNTTLPYKIVFLVSTQEEVGLRGTKMGAYSLQPDAAIVVDVTHAITPAVKSSDGFELGTGAAIAVGPNIDPSLYEKFLTYSQEAAIPHTIEVCPGSSGTNAWAIQVIAGGVPCAVISVPIRYMHTPNEIVAIQDLESVVNLICGVVGGCKL